MNEAQRKSWTSFVAVVGNFLGKRKAENYVEGVNEIRNSFKSLGCNMRIKVHYLHCHLDRFPKNLGDTSEQQGGRFHQDIKTTEDLYQGRWDNHMMTDYCWSLKETVPKYIQEMSLKRSFRSV
ncbi:hypothetical protein AVEN_231688-1 [Araneus ventricosus]|uniref:Uncharacterized protein n=1 Tax=Araneus ventricosus TaxID=182803 RepID=A0A4Y2K944_ARAVE|nr:hypothetical protein AVEN_193618-1 [Araneus ventricosus]GBM98954.1 hypothetical protein AVEN_231688-1 [Araneus ventricosus]